MILGVVLVTSNLPTSTQLWGRAPARLLLNGTQSAILAPDLELFGQGRCITAAFSLSHGHRVEHGLSALRKTLPLTEAA